MILKTERVVKYEFSFNIILFENVKKIQISLCGRTFTDNSKTTYTNPSIFKFGLYTKTIRFIIQLKNLYIGVS